MQMCAVQAMIEVAAQTLWCCSPHSTERLFGGCARTLVRHHTTPAGTLFFMVFLRDTGVLYTLGLQFIPILSFLADSTDIVHRRWNDIYDSLDYVTYTY